MVVWRLWEAWRWQLVDAIGVSGRILEAGREILWRDERVMR